MRVMHADGEVVYLANDVEVEIARLRGTIERQKEHLRGASTEGRRKNRALRSMNKTISRLQKRIAELEARLAAAEADRDFWQQDSATAWDKCEDRRLQAVAAEAGEDALAKAGSEARIALAGMVRPDNAVNLLDDALAAHQKRRAAP